MINLARLYGIIVENILHNNTNPEIPVKLYSHEQYGSAPSTKGRKKDTRMVGNVLKHQESLCEACSKGVCVGFYRPKFKHIKLISDEEDDEKKVIDELKKK